MYKVNKKTKITFLIAIVLLLSLVRVVVAADPVFIDVPSNITVAQDANYNFTVTAYDPDAEYPLNFTDDSEGLVPVFYMKNYNQTAALINFTPTNDDVNEHTGGEYISIIIYDDGTPPETEISTFLVNITNVNDAPNITSYDPADLTPSVAENLSTGSSFNYTASDPDSEYGDVLTVEWLKDGVNQSSNTTWTYYPNWCEAGSYNITLNVTDSDGLSDTQTWNITVNNTNRVPVLNNTLENVSVTEDINNTNAIDLDEYFYDNDTMECSGSNKDNLTFNVTGNSSVEVVINTSDNKVSFNPTPNWFGNETIYFTAYDQYNTTDSNNITINVTNVNDAPVLDAIANQTLAENVSFRLTVNASDPDNNISPGLDTLTFYDNTSLFDINSSSGLINFTPHTPDIGIHIVNITVGDGSLNDSQLVWFNITPNNPPILDSIANQTVEEGTAFSLTVTASDADNDTLTFSSNYSRFTITSINSTAADFNFTPTNDDVGNHSITIYVNDTWNASDSEVIWLNISNINNPPVLDAIENQTITLNKTFMLNISATDADGDSLTFYSNDSKFNITTINSTHGSFNLTFDSTDDIGNYTVNITVSDSAKNDSQLLGFSIYDNRQPVFDSIGQQNLTEDSIFFLNISASDADNDDLTFGTNSTMFNLTAVNASMATLNFTPNASQVGVYNITFNVTDDTFKVNMTVIFNITEFDDIPYFDPPLENFSGTQDTLFTYNVNATDEENGTDEINETLHFSTNATFFTINETTGLINFTPTNADVGNHTINISVNDTVKKNTTTIWFFVLQSNDPPNITAFSPNATFNMSENTSQYFNVTVNEPDGDTVTYSWLLDGVQQTTDTNWTYEAGFGSAGNRNITVEVSDGTLTDSQYWNVTVINVNRAPIFALKTQTNETDFTGGTNARTNATAQAGNITLVTNSSSAYYKSGNFTSSAIDLGADSGDIASGNISWQLSVVDGTNITMQTRTSADNSVWTSWSNLYTNSSTSINSTDNRYIQYRAFLSTNDTTNTPVLEEVGISYLIANFSGVEDTVYVNWIDLDNFFEDPDGTALNYTADCSTSSLTVTIANGSNYVTLTPASNWYGTATLTFTANDSEADATSNEITLTFTDVGEPGTTTTTSGGGGGGGGASTIIRTQTRLLNISEPQFFELVVPGPLSAGPNDTIIAPILLKNDGNKTLEGIDMFASANTTQITFEFTKRHFERLYSRAVEKTNLIITTHNVTGSYSVRVEARVKKPEVKDSAIIHMNVLEDVSGRIRYVRDLFMVNPECLELNELVIQAQAALKNAEYGKASYLLDQAIEGCKYLLSAGPRELKLSKVKGISSRIIASVAMIIIILLLVFVYYLIKRGKKKGRERRKKEEKEESEAEAVTWT